MLTHLTVGPATIPSYPFLALLGLWAGMWLAAKEAGRLGRDGDHIYNIGLYSLLAGLLGGRLWYVLAHWEAYTGAPIQAAALTANAIFVPGAVIFAGAAAIVYGLRHRLSPGLLADAVAPGAALALVIGGVGAFLGSRRLGAPTALPWGIEQFDAVRHPAHLYQTLATLLVLAIVWRVRRASHRPGFCFLLFVALYAGTRLLLEPAFAMPVTTGGGFRLVQVSALAATVVALTGMAWLDKPYAVKH